MTKRASVKPCKVTRKRATPRESELAPQPGTGTLQAVCLALAICMHDILGKSCGWAVAQLIELPMRQATHFTVAALVQPWRPFMKLSYSAAAMMCIESWSLSICTVAAGLLPDPDSAVAATAGASPLSYSFVPFKNECRIVLSLFVPPSKLLLSPMLHATLAQHACHSFHAAQAPRAPRSEDRMFPMLYAVCFNLYGIISMAVASFRAAACTRWARAAYCTAKKQFDLPVPESCCSSQIHTTPTLSKASNNSRLSTPNCALPAPACPACPSMPCLPWHALPALEWQLLKAHRLRSSASP